MKVWLVLKYDAEGAETLHICATKELAVKKLFEERDKLIADWKKMDKFLTQEYGEKDNEYKRMIKSLSGDDYENWDNYPNDCLAIEEMELEIK